MERRKGLKTIMNQHIRNNDLKYVPMLRGKAAEFDALRDLTSDIKDRMMPLVEVPVRDLNFDDPATPEKLKDKLYKVAKSIEASWDNRRLLLDLGHIHPELRSAEGQHPVSVMWEQANLISLFPPTPIPVVGLGRSPEYLNAVRAVLSGTEQGYCLRLSTENLLSPHFHQDVTSILNFFSSTPSNVDLIFDFGLVDENGFDLFALCEGLPYLQQWRTFTTVGGAFPVDLTGMELGNSYRPRWEWRSYRAQTSISTDIPRVPAFGDYTIQHPIYIEPGNEFVPSASIRYSCDEDTLVMKGQKPNEDNGGHKQYVAHAKMLSEHEHFLGAQFSAGDAYIAQKADAFEKILELDKGGTGGSREWLYAGINHHLTLATHQLREIFVS
jgi:hypothetical protein